MAGSFGHLLANGESRGSSSAEKDGCERIRLLNLVPDAAGAALALRKDAESATPGRVQTLRN
jgi:hypothetical protein